MNFIDKTIAAFSPSWAYKRGEWREALKHRFYDSGSNDRLNHGWTAVNTMAEQTDQGSRDIIRARARDLERNSDISESIIGAFERNVIGTGMQVQAKVLKPDGSDNDELNTQIEELWKEWCKARNCDVTGTQTFLEMQQMAIRRLIVDGAVIFIKAYTSDGIVPFSLQAREIDELDTSMSNASGVGGNKIISGIELNRYNKPVAYWFKKYTPEGFWNGETERIEAKNVIYAWKKTRPSQIREISSMSKTIRRVRDVNEFVEAISVKERILACLSVFITKVSPGTGIGRGTNSIDSKSGYKSKTISPGMIQELQPGETVSAVNPSGQSSNAKDFISTQQRLAGSGQGLSYEAVSRDMSQVNYSSARQGLLEDQRSYAMWQQFIIDHICDEVYTEFLISAVLSKQLDIKDFWQNKKKYMRHEWVSPGWSWIDPLKEVKANETALNTGQDTLARICAERGQDWRDVLKQRAAEEAYKKELALKQSNADNNSESEKEKENKIEKNLAKEDDNKSNSQSKIESEKTEEANEDKPKETTEKEEIILNGAQISSLLEIVQAVNNNTLTYDSAVALIVYSFPFTEEQAKEILGIKKDGGGNSAKNEETETGASNEEDS
ncbi:phage portal protein [Ruminiclostridium herbifermentans]|uniref:Phage portal protein n=1 Tax=Ruminiclostridium herbifermentans TaxID=2488810 RepID=A0A4U7J925_9FIRM|nr:phage portal protein [Ruminiclostridium herbifermentans]QNU67255.1 phage portal protein [Ruminiclostridium herbifermentans]